VDDHRIWNIIQHIHKLPQSIPISELAQNDI